MWWRRTNMSQAERIERLKNHYRRVESRNRLYFTVPYMPGWEYWEYYLETGRN
jgi:hypothetical protein